MTADLLFSAVPTLLLAGAALGLWRLVRRKAR